MERWGRARRKTERLIDFDGSSGVPQRDHTYSRQPTSCQFSARFYDYSCPGVAEETFTRHKRPASQICSPPVVVSDNSFHSSLFPRPFLSVLSLKPHRWLPPSESGTRRNCCGYIRHLRFFGGPAETGGPFKRSVRASELLFSTAFGTCGGPTAVVVNN